MHTTQKSKKEKTNAKTDANSSGLAEHLRAIFYALLIALFIRTVLYQPFSIPSSSMLPTLLVGDYIFVSKFSYGFSRHSLPFSPPLFAGRLMPREIKRGDVAVFKLPHDGRTDYIKRVIGLPGDRVQMQRGVLYINGEMVARQPVPFDTLSIDARRGLSPIMKINAYRETLPNGVSYIVLDMGHKDMVDSTPVFIVPHGHYFMMGDNRDNSQDSRFPHAVGFIPYENFVGHAQVKFYSFDNDSRFWQIWNYPDAIRWQRIFEAIR